MLKRKGTENRRARKTVRRRSHFGLSRRLVLAGASRFCPVFRIGRCWPADYFLPTPFGSVLTVVAGVFSMLQSGLFPLVLRPRQAGNRRGLKPYLARRLRSSDEHEALVSSAAGALNALYSSRAGGPLDVQPPRTAIFTGGRSASNDSALSLLGRLASAAGRRPSEHSVAWPQGL